MSRSRAFNIQIDNYAQYELATLRTWLNAAPMWLLRYDKDKLQARAYVRFDKQMSIEKVRRAHSGATVEGTTAKYKHVAEEYSKLGYFESKYSRSIARDGCEQEWQKEILATLAIKAERGVVRWIDDPFYSAGVSHLLKNLSTLPNVLIIHGLAADIRARVREELIIKTRTIDTIVLTLPLMRRIDGCYFQIINELRDGYVADVLGDGNKCTYDVINILVATPSELRAELVERMRIVKVYHVDAFVMTAKPEWHEGILHSLQTEKNSIQWLVTKPANCKETFHLLHDLADIPNVLISGKSFASIKTMVMKMIHKKTPIDTLVILTKRVESHLVHDMLAQLSSGMLLDCRIGGKDCRFDPFNVLVISDAYPPIYVVQDIGVCVSFINNYDRYIFEEACPPRVCAM